MAIKDKKQHLRMCVSCREMRDKRMLTRIVKSPEGAVAIDLSGKRPGRGAYICLNDNCLKKAQKAKSLERALKVKVDQNIWDQLSSMAAAINGDQI